VIEFDNVGNFINYSSAAYSNWILKRMDERFDLIHPWLEGLEMMQGSELSEIVPASADASFRRYFRVVRQADQQSFVIMDAPPQHENCLPFIEVSQQLRSFGLNVPEVIAKNLELGFLLLTDLGSLTLMNFLKDASDTEMDHAYRATLKSLALLNRNGEKARHRLPDYNAALLETEMNLFSDWLIGEHLQSGMNALQTSQWEGVKTLLRESALAQPKTFVHRDYHSRNLMVQVDGSVGVLDFQDAVNGPLNYDAVSLLRDCYVAWPDEQVKEWQRFYFLELVAQQQLSHDEWRNFQMSMDLMGVQRHLKASGIFCRLLHRDGKDGYMADVPQTLDYIVKVSRQYPQLMALVDIVEKLVLPRWTELT
jgi:aminoglycoside/choline kinase family phosphotransferase